MGMTDQERDEFLNGSRYGILSHQRKDDSVVAVPVWFEWDGTKAQMFTMGMSPKVKRLERNPSASLLVVNAVEEPEAWVALEGDVAIRQDSESAFALAERMAPRYWDLTDEGRKQTLELWRQAKEALWLLELVPKKIRSFKY